MLSLLNRGLIPQDVDLTPAFERGKATLTSKIVIGAKKEQRIAPEVSKPMSRRKQLLLMARDLKAQELEAEGKKDNDTFLTQMEP